MIRRRRVFSEFARDVENGALRWWATVRLEEFADRLAPAVELVFDKRDRVTWPPKSRNLTESSVFEIIHLGGLDQGNFQLVADFGA